MVSGKLSGLRESVPEGGVDDTELSEENERVKSGSTSDQLAQVRPVVIAGGLGETQSIYCHIFQPISVHLSSSEKDRAEAVRRRRPMSVNFRLSTNANEEFTGRRGGAEIRGGKIE